MSDPEQLLLQLQCPFTWDMSEYILYTKDVNEYIEEANLVPQIQFIKLIMRSYIRVLNLYYCEAEKNIQEAEKEIVKLQSLRKEVAKHILDSTKAHLLMKKGNLEAVKEILKNISDISDKKYCNALNEFQAIVWTEYEYHTTIPSNIALKFANMVIKCDPESAIAHYVIGRNLRWLRRGVTVFSSSGKDEIYHLSKAFELDNNPHFGLYLGQAFKEGGNREKAYVIFNEIHKMNIPKQMIQMRLALYFMQNGYLDKCKQCLDYVESVCPERSMFLHYKGLYLMKINKYQEAAECLLKTSDQSNYGADLAYAKCMRKLGKRFDFPAYFLDVLERNEVLNNNQRKDLLLHIAFSYFNFKRDLRESIKYLLDAFEIEAQDYSLKNYRDPFTGKEINVYQFIFDKVFPEVEKSKKNQLIHLPENTLLAYEKLKEFYEDYSKSLWDTNSKRKVVVLNKK